MFIGEYTHSLDKKGRIAIPKKFREKLSGKCVATRGLDDCLFLYGEEEWEEISEEVANLPLSKSDSRAFSRLMLAGAMELDIDSQGRILIPDYLRDYADLDKKVVFTGIYSRIELWDEEVWDKYKNKTEKEGEDIAERLDSIDI